MKEFHQRYRGASFGARGVSVVRGCGLIEAPCFVQLREDNLQRPTPRSSPPRQAILSVIVDVDDEVQSWS